MPRVRSIAAALPLAAVPIIAHRPAAAQPERVEIELIRAPEGYRISPPAIGTDEPEYRWFGDINRDGTVVTGMLAITPLAGGQGVPPTSRWGPAFRWDSETSDRFEILEADARGGAVSADGLTIYGAYLNPLVALPDGLFRWTPAGVEDLGVPEGVDQIGEAPFVRGVSDDGSSVVLDNLATLWRYTDRAGFEQLTPDDQNSPVGFFPIRRANISGDGSVITGTENAAIGFPWRHTDAAGFAELPNGPAGFYGFEPGGISFDGSMIVGEFLTGDQPGAEFQIWSESGGFTRIAEDPRIGRPRPGAIAVVGMSDDGQVVAGTSWMYNPVDGTRLLLDILMENQQALAEEVVGADPFRNNEILGLSGDGRKIVVAGIFAPADNPSSETGTPYAVVTLPRPCNDIDYAEPRGVMSQRDVLTFLERFNDNSPTVARLAEPLDVASQLDVARFVELFFEG
ncbi:MAG: hypothetical protein AAFU70_05690, partial [Planctomycetota bacterium]